MKKLLSVLAALTLLITCAFSAGAEDVAAAQPKTVTVKLNVDGSILAAMTGASDESAAKVTQTIADVINSLGIIYVSDGVDGELTLTLKDTPVTSFAILKDDSVVRILSDLFPNYILSLSQESLGAFMPQKKASGDPEQMAAALAEPVTKLMAEFSSRTGEPEQVEETIYDTQFTVKTPVNMTAREAVLLVLNTAKEVLSSEQSAPLLAYLKQSNINVDVASIDSAIEDINNQTDEELPTLDMAYFTNEAEDTASRISLVKDDQNMLLTCGTVSGRFMMDLSVLDQMTFTLRSETTGAVNFSMNFAQDGMSISLNGAVLHGEISSETVIDLTINDMKALTVNVLVEYTGALSGSFSTEGKTELSLENIQDQGDEAAQGFMADVQVGLVQLLTKAMQAFPELMVLMQPSQSSPQ